MLIQQDKGLKQLNQFFQALQAPLGLHQRRLLQRQRRHDALNRLYNRLLRRSGHPVIPRLRNRNRIKPQAQPGFQPFLRAVVLAVRQRRQLNRAAHVAGIGHGCRELIKRVMPAFHDGGGN